MVYGRGFGGGGRYNAPGGGRRRQPGGFGLGPSGECVCPNCGKRTSHQVGYPCNQIPCPNCGTTMTRGK